MPIGVQSAPAIEALLEAYSSEENGVTARARAILYDGFNTKLEAAGPRGHGPDLFIAAHERLGSWVQQGLIRANPEALSGVSETVEQALFHEGQHYGTPLAFKTLALFTNRALIDAPPTTTDDLRARAAAERDAGRVGLAYQATEPFFHAPWMNGSGGALQDEDGFALDRPEAIAALEFLVELQNEKLLVEEPTAVLVTQLFNEGRAGMVINGPVVPRWRSIRASTWACLRSR